MASSNLFLPWAFFGVWDLAFGIFRRPSCREPSGAKRPRLAARVARVAADRMAPRTPAGAGAARAVRRGVAPAVARRCVALARHARVRRARAPDRRARPAAAGRGQARSPFRGLRHHARDRPFHFDAGGGLREGRRAHQPAAGHQAGDPGLHRAPSRRSHRHRALLRPRLHDGAADLRSRLAGPRSPGSNRPNATAAANAWAPSSCC
jgi:hypothetical protein